MNAPGEEWKALVLEDFRRWLETLPAAAEIASAWEDPDDGFAGGGDLQGVFSEIAALRQEVRSQNREQSKSTRALSEATELSAGLADLVRQRDQRAAVLTRERTDDLGEVDRRARAAGEEDVVRRFLEVRDALARGADAVRKAGAQNRRFWRADRKGLQSLAEGYDMALRRFDRVLGELDVKAIPAVGRPFDGRVMHASRTVSVSGKPDGEVVEEYRAGYTRGGEVLRLADVGVNRAEAGES